MRHLLAICFFLGSLSTAVAQHQRAYFRNPLGIPMQLAANFGEVRTDHFHMGFDLRTNQRENLPVYAAAEGYISRVLIEPGGYGRALYITHPAGYTTLYAHLNNFYPSLQEYVEDKQYREEQWMQDISLPAGKFPVSKRQFIAYSGNTGASQGPHLHFEIRDSRTGNNVNPRLFNFPIADTKAPFIYSLFMYDRHFSTYRVDPSQIKIKGTKGIYTTRDSLILSPSNKISFAISAEDISNTSSFRFGVYSAEIWMDGDSLEKFSFTLDEMNYEDSRYLNASIDYKQRYTNGDLIQHLSRLPGNKLSIFNGSSDGIIHLTDTLPHSFRILVKDVAGNTSQLNYRLAWKPSLYQERFFTENTEKMAPGRENKLVRDNLVVTFPASSFYDTVHFFHAELNPGVTRFPVHQLHYHHLPVHDAYTVELKAPTDSDTRRMIWKLTTGKTVITQQAEYENGIFHGRFNKLGTLTLVEDTTPPSVSPVGWKDGQVFSKTGSITLLAKDDVSRVQELRAELDGKWLMFSRKENTYVYNFDKHCPLGKHELKITATDIAGNVTVRTYNFELKEKLPAKKKVKRKPVKKKKR